MKLFYLLGFQPQIAQPIAQSLSCLPTTTVKKYYSLCHSCCQAYQTGIDIHCVQVGDCTNPELGINFSYAVSNLHILKSCLKYDNKKKKKKYMGYTLFLILLHIYTCFEHRIYRMTTETFTYKSTHTHTHTQTCTHSLRPLSLQEITM
jgi:hypothetical protein